MNMKIVNLIPIIPLILLKNLKYIIYDDYGVFPGVKKVVNEFVRKGILSIVSFVGLTSIPTISGVNIENTYEGVICKIIK